jgi:hypothetical protein
VLFRGVNSWLICVRFIGDNCAIYCMELAAGVWSPPPKDIEVLYA